MSLLNHNYIIKIFFFLLKQEHINRVSSVDFKRRSLSAGFSHVALIRNGDVYTWGSSIQGCLGKRKRVYKNR